MDVSLDRYRPTYIKRKIASVGEIGCILLPGEPEGVAVELEP